MGWFLPTWLEERILGISLSFRKKNRGQRDEREFVAERNISSPPDLFHLFWSSLQYWRE